MEFTILNAQGDTQVVKLKGNIKDGIEATLSALLAQVTKAGIILDCSDIALMNSTGIGEWCRFQGALDKRGVAVEYRNVPTIMMHFAGLIRGFFGKATISSVHVPFMCDQCSHYSDVLIQAADLRRTRALPEEKCSKCGAKTVPEVDADGYVEALLDSLGGAA